jgi:hypothetical protein
MGLPQAIQVALKKNALSLEKPAKLPRKQALRLPGVGKRVLEESRKQVNQAGGYRPGAGRKAADGASKVMRVTVTLTQEQRDKLKRLGGSVFVRQAINDADDY